LLLYFIWTVDRICGEDTGCTHYFCAAGTCQSSSKCDASNLCNPSSCNGTACIAAPVTCTSTACTTQTCNPATGHCDPTVVNCDDSNACTDDSCDVVNGCQHAPKTCSAVTDPCTLDLGCDSTTGACVTAPKTCDDGIICTIDKCTAGVCSNIPNDLLCNSTDPCVNASVCSVASNGCALTPQDCGAGTFCKPETCIAYFGCSTDPIDCSGNYSNTTCDTYNCSDVKSQCVKNVGACFSFIGIVAGIVVAGVVVGTVAAALILAGASVGGGAYAISQTVNQETQHHVSHNPLYHGQGRGAEVTI